MYIITLQTCLLARELGISCTISPDHMVNATVPDKLAIASFVYQLYSFFNENIPSAVTPAANNPNIPTLPGNGMAEFDKITMAKLNSESSLVNNSGDQQKLPSDRLRKYSRHAISGSVSDNDAQVVNNDDTAATSGDIVTELFPIVQSPSSNGVDENGDGVPPSHVDNNIDEMFPVVGGGSVIKEEDTPTNEVAANDLPNIVVNSPTSSSLLSRIRAKSPEQEVPVEHKITAEEMTEDVVIVRRDSESRPAIPESPLDDYKNEDQDIINLDVTVNEVTVSML